uniref:Uncharacterized protein n=2 Tax=viral metagenome TaxID=1070528 RepID=A0A6M3JQS4_9ZZZZ
MNDRETARDLSKRLEKAYEEIARLEGALEDIATWAEGSTCEICGVKKMTETDNEGGCKMRDEELKAEALRSAAKLRPVGTIYVLDFPPDFSTSDGPFWKTITYRVKAHVEVSRFKGDKIGRLTEEIEAVEIREFYATQKWFPGNQFIWEKGESV